MAHKALLQLLHYGAMMNKRINWATVALVLVIFSAVSVGLYLKQQRTTVTPQVIELEATTGCDPVSQRCEASNKSIQLQLHFPTQPVYLAPFPVEVSVAGSHTVMDAVVIDFKMTGMDMGINKAVLSKSKPSGHPEQQLWKGNMTLPVCITGRADWLALLQVSAGETVYQASFPVKVEKTSVNSH